MPFLIRPSRRLPVYCPITYHCGLFEGHGTVWNVWSGVNMQDTKAEMEQHVGGLIGLVKQAIALQDTTR